MGGKTTEESVKNLIKAVRDLQKELGMVTSVKEWASMRSSSCRSSKPLRACARDQVPTANPAIRLWRMIGRYKGLSGLQANIALSYGGIVH